MDETINTVWQEFLEALNEDEAETAIRLAGKLASMARTNGNVPKIDYWDFDFLMSKMWGLLKNANR